MGEGLKRARAAALATRVTPQQQLGFLSRDVLPVLESVVSGYVYDPGSSDLDDEQPIHVRMTLGDYRRAARLLPEVRKCV